MSHSHLDLREFDSKLVNAMYRVTSSYTFYNSNDKILDHAIYKQPILVHAWNVDPVIKFGKYIDDSTMWARL